MRRPLCMQACAVEGSDLLVIGTRQITPPQARLAGGGFSLPRNLRDERKSWRILVENNGDN